jgi:hypothetical protein
MGVDRQGQCAGRIEAGLYLFDVGTPRVYADIDRRKADLLGVPPERIFEALEVYLGSAFVNDFNLWAAPIASPHRPTRNTARPWPTLPT